MAGIISCKYGLCAVSHRQVVREDTSCSWMGAWETWEWGREGGSPPWLLQPSSGNVVITDSMYHRYDRPYCHLVNHTTKRCSARALYHNKIFQTMLSLAKFSNAYWQGNKPTRKIVWFHPETFSILHSVLYPRTGSPRRWWTGRLIIITPRL